MLFLFRASWFDVLCHPTPHLAFTPCASSTSTALIIHHHQAKGIVLHFHRAKLPFTVINMLQQPPAPPAGPRASRQATRPTSTRLSNRGGIQKRNSSAPARVDKDGDLVMSAGGTAGRTAGSGRGASIRGSALNRRQNTPDSLAARTSTRPTRTGIDTPAVQKAVLRGLGSNEALPRGPRSGLRSARGRENTREPRDSFHRIRVWGLKESKAASNADGGIKDLLAFLERKATNPEAPAREAVKINKVCLTLQFAGHPHSTPRRLSGPLSFQVKLSERRPRYAAPAFG